MENSNRLLNLLGMCRKAKKLACGHDAAVQSIRAKQAALCILSSDSSPRLYEESLREITISTKDVPVVKISNTMEEIGHATGLRSAVLTVNDDGFAKAMLKLCENQVEV